MTELRLSGWGRTAWSTSEVVSTSDVAIAREAAVESGPRGATARGLGRAYGAAAQNAGGRVIEFLDRSGALPIDLDVETGVLRASAAVSIEEVLHHSVPRGWFVPVTPGTRLVTLGGAVASDVHGKNHHVDGSIGRHVERIGILLSDGRRTEIGPDLHPDWFWATVGGMGLTGLITDVVLRMRPVETAAMRVETRRIPDIDSMFTVMSEDDDSFPYSVAWIDLMATGRSLGRGVLTVGRHASLAETGKTGADTEYRTRALLGAPRVVPNGLLNRASIRAFNEMWYRRAPRKPEMSTESIPAFFHPLDGVRNWNRMYGRSGFVQYQFIVPPGREDAMTSIVAEFARGGIGSFLAVLKKMGPSNEGMLSFPTEGWTLALDLPAGSDRLAPLLHRIDEMVIDSGGRHYLAKDCHLMPWAVRAGYPRLKEWQKVRDEMDPIGIWTSDLARRLDLVPMNGNGRFEQSKKKDDL